MIAPEHFEVMEGYCCYRLTGQGPLAEAAGKVILAIDYSREQKVRNLLIDTTNWTGSANLSEPCWMNGRLRCRRGFSVT